MRFRICSNPKRVTDEGDIQHGEKSAAKAKATETQESGSARDKVQRSILPIPDAKHVGLTTYDAKDPDTKFPPIEQLRPPKGAPNVLIVLLDDVGFAASSAFGGPIHTPTAERLAKGGLKFNRFHTTALCSPTRQALLTGRNHHSVNMGGICEIATSAPGYSSVLPKDKAPLAMTLKLNGYSTAQFGKCHEVPVWETSPMGPFDQWPTGGGGFEYFYGFIGGETNQWYPAHLRRHDADRAGEDAGGGLPLHRGHDRPRRSSWIAPAEGADARQAVLHLLRARRHATPRTTSRQEWTDKYKGKFDHGWDKLREEIVRAPEEARRHSGRTPSSRSGPTRFRPGTTCRRTCKPDLRARDGGLRRASSSTSTTMLGRLVDTLEGARDPRRHADLPASSATTAPRPKARRTAVSTRWRSSTAWARSRPPSSSARRSTTSAGRTPTTTTPSAGRTRWTRRISGPSRSRRISAARATARSSTGRTASKRRARSAASSATSSTSRRRFSKRPSCRIPRIVNSIQQAPIEGVSMLYAFNDAKAAERHETQYFEMFCNRGIYHKGWTAVTRHGVPWVGAYKRTFDDDVWELYDTNKDWTQAQRSREAEAEEARRAPASVPDRGDEVQRAAARRPDVRAVQPRPRRPTAADQGQHPDSLRRHGRACRRTPSFRMKNQSYSVTADDRACRKPVPRASSSLRAATSSGWSLYAKDGKLKYCYNFFGSSLTFVEATQAIPAGKHQVRMEFKYDGGGLAQGRRRVSLYIDGKTGRRGASSTRTVPMVFSADETCDVGKDSGSPVSPDYGPVGQRVQRRASTGCRSTSTRTITTT